MWKSMLKDGSWVGFLSLIALGLFLVALGVYHSGRQPYVILLFLVLSAVPIGTAFIALRYRKRRYGDGPVTDERERLLRMRADNIGSIGLMIAWTLAFVIPFGMAYLKGEQTITIDRTLLPLIFSCGLGVFAVVRTIALWRIRKRELTNAKK